MILVHTSKNEKPTFKDKFHLSDKVKQKTLKCWKAEDDRYDNPNMANLRFYLRFTRCTQKNRSLKKWSEWAADILPAFKIKQHVWDFVIDWKQENCLKCDWKTVNIQTLVSYSMYHNQEDFLHSNFQFLIVRFVRCRWFVYNHLPSALTAWSPTK